MTSNDTSAIRSWFIGRLPEEWTTTAPPSINVDRDEIVVTLSIDPPTLDDEASDVDRAEAVVGRISGFRDETRERRIAVAREAEHRFERKVSWAVSVGERTELFTHLAAPVMTRLRQPERQVLDTLVAARRRSQASAPSLMGSSKNCLRQPKTGAVGVTAGRSAAEEAVGLDTHQGQRPCSVTIPLLASRRQRHSSRRLVTVGW
jgi:hypothetical protein